MGLTANPLMKINLGHQEVDRLIDELIAVYQSTPVEWLTVKPIAQYLCIDLGYEDEGEFEDALNGTFIEFLSALPNVELRKVPAPNGTANAESIAKKARTEAVAHKGTSAGSTEESAQEDPFTVDPTHKQTAQAKEDAAAQQKEPKTDGQSSDIPVTTVTDDDDAESKSRPTSSNSGEVWEFKIKPEPEQKDWKPKTMQIVIRERSQLWNVLLKSQYASIEIPHMEFEVSADGKRKVCSVFLMLEMNIG